MNGWMMDSVVGRMDDCSVDPLQCQSIDTSVLSAFNLHGKNAWHGFSLVH